MKFFMSFLAALLALFLVVVPVFSLDYASLGFSPPGASGLGSGEVVFSGADDSESLSVTVQDDLVYRYGYYSIGGGSWESFELSGQDLYGGWIPGGAWQLCFPLVGEVSRRRRVLV